ILDFRFWILDFSWRMWSAVQSNIKNRQSKILRPPPSATKALGMDPLPLLQDLVAIPSVNPMGRDLSGPDFLEGRVSDYLEDFFRRLGATCQRIEVAPGRANVLARFESPGAKATVLLDAHQDTVPTDGMPDPFNPVIRDGKLFGRGSCDVKGGLAAMLSAFARL